MRHILFTMTSLLDYIITSMDYVCFELLGNSRYLSRVDGSEQYVYVDRVGPYRHVSRSKLTVNIKEKVLDSIVFVSGHLLLNNVHGNER